MNVTIQLPHSAETETLRAHADRALRFALTRFTGAVRDIRLRLVDENGPRGGTDQRCRVSVALHQGGTIQVEATDSDAHAVIQRAAARAAHTLGRKLDRARER